MPERAGVRALKFYVVPMFAGHYQGSFVVIDERGVISAPRTEEGSNCEEVIDALSLSASLALAHEAPKEPERPAAWSYSLGAAATVDGYAAPSALPGAKIYLRAKTDSGLSLYAGAAWTGLGLTRSGRVSSHFDWWKAQVAVCPLETSLSPTLSLAPCAAAQVGVLHAEAQGAPNARSDSSAWLEAGVDARLAWRLSSRISLDAAARASAPLLRADFVVNPNYRLYRPPAFALGAELGASVFF